MKDDYKLGRILATSAIVSDRPPGPTKPKRTKIMLIIFAVILGYIGFALHSSKASADIWDEDEPITAENMIA